MNLSPRPLTLFFMLAVGCVAGTAATQLVSPPASATGPGATPPTAPQLRWAYRCDSGANVDDLNRIGAVGWELVSVGPVRGDILYCFKRPY